MVFKFLALTLWTRNAKSLINLSNEAVKIPKKQGWHIGIGRYEISADIGHIGKTDISVSVIIPADTYWPICNIGNLFHIGGYRSKFCIISVKKSLTFAFELFWYSGVGFGF